MNACEKFYWIKDHIAFLNSEHMPVELEIDPHMVCPLTNRIEEYKPLNTKHQLWVEVLIPSYDEDSKSWEHAHDWDLDTGGDTWEEMIEKLYELVLAKYGDYTDDDYVEKFNEVNNIIIYKSPIARPAKKQKYNFKVKFNSPKWAADKLDGPHTEMLKDDIHNTEQTIMALTEFRKTCTIDLQAEVDIELQKNSFVLFEQRLSLETGFDMVGK